MKKFLKKHWFRLLWLVIIAIAFFVRLYKIDQIPPSPYWEEAALGFDAYSILQTGMDHHGNKLPVVAFESFGDWKPSLYFYAIVPFITLFNLGVVAVRMPSVLSGVLIVIGVGQLAKSFSDKKMFQLFAMFVTSISPWAIQFSRSGWESNLATCLILWGVVLFIRSIEVGLDAPKKKILFSILGASLLSLSTYAYHSARILAPILGLTLFLMSLKKKQLLQSIKILIPSAVIAFLLVLPIGLSLNQKTINNRFMETSIFSDISVIEQSNYFKQLSNNSFVSRILYHRYLLFGKQILTNFANHFSPNFLFLTGDSNPRHSVQYFAHFYHFEIILLLLGAFYWFKNWNRKYLLLLVWLIVGLIPASITKASPHALRILPTLPVWMLLLASGLSGFLQQFTKKLRKPLLLVVLAAYLVEFSILARYYIKIYAVEYSQEWQYGYQQLIEKVAVLEQEYPSYNVYFSREKGRPAMYYWFYTKTDPRLVQQAEQTAAKDQSEFLEFKNISFEGLAQERPAIAALTLNETNTSSPELLGTKIDQIVGLDGRVIWNIFLLE